MSTVFSHIRKIQRVLYIIEDSFDQRRPFLFNSVLQYFICNFDLASRQH